MKDFHQFQLIVSMVILCVSLKECFVHFKFTQPVLWAVQEVLASRGASCRNVRVSKLLCLDSKDTS